MKKMARGKVATVLMYTYPYSEGPKICELQREWVKYDTASKRGNNLPQCLYDAESAKQPSDLNATFSGIHSQGNALNSWRESAAYSTQHPKYSERNWCGCEAHKRV